MSKRSTAWAKYLDNISDLHFVLCSSYAVLCIPLTNRFRGRYCNLYDSDLQRVRWTGLGTASKFGRPCNQF